MKSEYTMRGMGAGKDRAYTKYDLFNTPSYHVVDGDKRKFRGCTREAVGASSVEWCNKTT